MLMEVGENKSNSQKLLETYHTVQKLLEANYNIQTLDKNYLPVQTPTDDKLQAQTKLDTINKPPVQLQIDTNTLNSTLLILYETLNILILVDTVLLLRRLPQMNSKLKFLLPLHQIHQ